MEGIFSQSISSVQLLSNVRLFANPQTAARQASLSITNSQNLIKFMSIELVMPSSHLILCRPLVLLPLIFPSIRVFPKSQFLASGGQSIGVSASASVQFSSVQLLSRVRLFATTWTTASQASLSITNSRSLPKLMSIESVVTYEKIYTYMQTGRQNCIHITQR